MALVATIPPVTSLAPIPHIRFTSRTVTRGASVISVIMLKVLATRLLFMVPYMLTSKGSRKAAATGLSVMLLELKVTFINTLGIT